MFALLSHKAHQAKRRLPVFLFNSSIDMASKKPSKAVITKVLKTILDPELFVSIVDLGLVYDIVLNDGTVNITMTLTTIGCPLFQTIENEVKEKVSAIPGIRSVNVELTFDPPWDSSRLSEKAKAELGME